MGYLLDRGGIVGENRYMGIDMLLNVREKTAFCQEKIGL